MELLKWLMIANVLFLILAFATKGTVRVFFFKVWTVLFVIAIVLVGIFVNNGTLRN